MVTRRAFVKTCGALGVSSFISSQTSAKIIKSDYKSKRPLVEDRKFVSKDVDRVLEEVSSSIKDDKLRWMFGNCFTNTLDTTVEFDDSGSKPDTFVITGDIHAMWLRDSAAQVWPYISFANKDKRLKQMLKGVINRQTKCVLIDPYANGFNKGAEGSEWDSDKTEMKSELHERKWEIDSLCYPVRLAYAVWKETGDTDCFDADWEKAMHLIIKTFKEQQRLDGKGPYSFMRETLRKTDNVSNMGWGDPVKPNGLICSTFRPSDDATTFLYLIPSNYFAVQSLKQMSEIAKTVLKNHELAKEAIELSEVVEGALKKYGIGNHPSFGDIIPFEADGYGNFLFMDDANIPSLISLPYLDAIDKESDLYHRTRRFVLSDDNPYFSKGSYAEGIGGPHVGQDYIWPMSIIMRAMTSDDSKEIEKCISMLVNTDADTGFMHESFNRNDPKDFTRSWFAWVNTLFGELIYKMYKLYPTLLDKEY